MNKLNYFLSFLVLSLNLFSDPLTKPTSFSKDLYKDQILEGNYSERIQHPDDFLGFGLGERVANPLQISQAVRAYQKQSDRIKVIEYGRTHEDRPLFAVFISSPSNIDRLSEIEQDISKLADARNTTDSEAKELIASLPAIAWMAYSIHGNET